MELRRRDEPLISRKWKGTPGLALPWCLRADNARPDALFWQELHSTFRFTGRGGWTAPNLLV